MPRVIFGGPAVCLFSLRCTARTATTRTIVRTLRAPISRSRNYDTDCSRNRFWRVTKTPPAPDTATPPSRVLCRNAPFGGSRNRFYVSEIKKTGPKLKKWSIFVFLASRNRKKGRFEGSKQRFGGGVPPLFGSRKTKSVQKVDFLTLFLKKYQKIVVFFDFFTFFFVQKYKKTR